MAASSTTSTHSARVNTGKTANLTPEMALEILQATIHKCLEAGIDVKITTFYGTVAGNSIAIILDGVDLVDGKLLPAIASNEES